MDWIGLRAETLTPFSYHSLMVQGGSATIPELIGDRALCFSLAATLGKLWASVMLPSKDYRRDLAAMRWRASVLTTEAPRLLRPLARRRNLDAEGGMPPRVQDAAKKGNLKDYFFIQEVPPGQVFRGALFGPDPFVEAGRDELVVRIGLHRNGMVRLTRDDGVEEVCLNAATAALFGRELPVARYLLHGLQLTAPMSVEVAAQEVARWK